MKALILKNKVVQVVENAKEFPVAPEMYWLDCEPGVQAGWVIINGIIQEDPKVIAERNRVKTPQELRQEKMPSIHEQLEDLWDAMDKGLLPKNNKFYAKRKKIYDDHPLPQGGN